MNDTLGGFHNTRKSVKLIKSNSNVELIKYNPGVRKENIYRLYTNGHFSKNGAKIPNLFVRNGNKKSKIIKRCYKKFFYLKYRNRFSNLFNRFLK